jgi:hypothetical protein
MISTGEGGALKGHAAAGRIGLGEIFERDRDQRSGREPHFLNSGAVTHGRWSAGASMAVRHNHGVTLGFDFFPKRGIVTSEPALRR